VFPPKLTGIEKHKSQSQSKADMGQVFTSDWLCPGNSSDVYAFENMIRKLLSKRDTCYQVKGRGNPTYW